MISTLFNLGLRTWAKGSANRFLRATNAVEAAQRRRLSAILDACRGTARGTDLGLDTVTTYAQFAGLPITEYEDYQPYIERIMAGDDRVLTTDPVTLLEPTMIVVVGLIVFVLILSVLLPIFQMNLLAR